MDTSLADNGRKFYEEKLKSLLEPEQNGRLIAIEPESESYFIAETSTAAILKALAALPDKQFYLGRIGFRTAHSIGGYGRSKRQSERVA